MNSQVQVRTTRVYVYVCMFFRRFNVSLLLVRVGDVRKWKFRIRKTQTDKTRHVNRLIVAGSRTEEGWDVARSSLLADYTGSGDREAGRSRKI